MARSHPVAFLALAVAVAACSAAGEGNASSTPEATEADILRLDSLYEAAEASKDTAALSALLADDFVLRVSGFVSKKPEYLALVANDSTRYVRRANTAGYAIVHGPTAVSGGLFLESSLAGADTLSMALRWMATWVRAADGKWRMLAELWVPVPPRKALPLAPGDSARVVGTYDLPDGPVTIAVRDGRLVMQPPAGPGVHLLNQGAGVFAVEEVETSELRFPVTESPASGFTLDMSGAVVKATRRR